MKNLQEKSDRIMDRRRFLLNALLASGALLTAEGARAETWLAPRSAAAKPKAAPAPAPKAAPAAPMRRIVALDPGHGGKDPGAIGRKGTYEKEITVLVATDLARRLEATGRYKVVMTRRSDFFLPLADRVRLAQKADSVLFMSLHADSAPSHDARGFSVYTLSEKASDSLAAAIAQRENGVDRIAGIDLSKHPREVRSILLDLLHRETKNNSLMMAETLVQTLDPPFSSLVRPHREANFAVLRAPEIPSVLVEMGFLSNTDDEKLLNMKSYQARLAERLVTAVDDYFHA
jgi:N-acetylmuramoyl-L-alanine amidase